MPTLLYMPVETITANVDSIVSKFFTGNGQFGGKVTEVSTDDTGSSTYIILFDDGDEEEWSQDDYNQHAKEVSINIGEVGHWFVRECPLRGGACAFFSGKVIEILTNGKRR